MCLIVDGNNKLFNIDLSSGFSIATKDDVLSAIFNDSGAFIVTANNNHSNHISILDKTTLN